MSTISGLYARFRQLIHEGFKFLVIGAIGAIITFGAANALHSIGKYKAITIATILATVATYLGNRYWTFRHRQGKGTTRDSIMFFVLNGVGLLIYYGCIGLIDVAGLGKYLAWYNVALVVGTGLGTLFRFWSYRRWIWLDTPVLEPGETTEERAEDLAAMVGAVPVTHHSVNGASANGASAIGAQANRATGRHTPPNGASASAASGPHRHARPGRPAFLPDQAEPPRDASGRTPASHRRTS